jgi:tetratricopeptide (TPR) repeat protein
MTEALVAALAQIDGLQVISRTSTLRYKTEHATVPEIARTLGVTLVLEGSVMLAGEQVRITAQLIDGATDEHLWAQSYTRRLRDVIALQDEVATTIGREILGTVARRPGGRPGQARAVDPAVYDLYLRGRHAGNQRTTDGLRAAIDYFSRAVAADERFALGHVGLADAFVLQGSPGMGLLDVRSAMDRARQSATRALDLDPSLAEAHTALAGVLFFGDRNYQAAEQAFTRALAINPNYSVAHEWLAVLLAELGRDREARSHAEQAVALSPLEGTMHQALGLVHYYARRHAEAVRAERRALELASSLPLARALLVKALLLGGDTASASAACDQFASQSDQDILVVCGAAYGRSGRTADAAALRARLEGLRPAPGVGLSQLEAALGDYKAAFDRLERLAARGNLPPALAFDPLFDGLRRHPRWPGIQARTAPAPAPRGW